MFSAKVDFNPNKVKKKMDAATKFSQYILDENVLKGSNFYIPMDSHNLERSGVTHSKLGNGLVAWGTPYARRLYYNPQYNFSKDVNPNARGKWYEAAKAKQRAAWIAAAKKAYKSRM